MAFGIHFQQTGHHQLPEHAAPGVRIQLRADAVGGQIVVAELADLFGVGTAQHVDQVRGPEALAAAVHAAQRLARGLGRVPGLGRVEAVVAVAAGRRRLAKVGEQVLAPAGGGLDQADQHLQAVAGQALELFAGFGLVDHAALLHHVLRTPGHPRLRPC